MVDAVVVVVGVVVETAIKTVVVEVAGGAWLVAVVVAVVVVEVVDGATVVVVVVDGARLVVVVVDGARLVVVVVETLVKTVGKVLVEPMVVATVGAEVFACLRLENFIVPDGLWFFLTTSSRVSFPTCVVVVVVAAVDKALKAFLRLKVLSHEN